MSSAVVFSVQSRMQMPECEIEIMTEDDDEHQQLVEFVDIAKLEVPKPVIFPLESCTLLNLTGCGLDKLPDGLADAFPNLSILFLSNNKFTTMPAIIGKCPKLQMVAFKSNGMKMIDPEALQPQLRWLILTDNEIEMIPATIGRCSNLQKCMLSGNKIRKLPETIAQCQKLELIRLASNRLEEPPLTLLQLPSLAWVALSDNPFLSSNGADGGQVPENLKYSVPVLPAELDDEEGEILGRGAGGVTRKVLYKGQPVAMKEYGALMTSDGLPSQERLISCAASSLSCPALIKVLGETKQKGSLVMEYLEDFGALAGPPNFDSCSRDEYPKDFAAMAPEEATKMVSELLQALHALHSRLGVCHGDFYAHNILVHRQNVKDVRLSDFGAAFFYDRKSTYGGLLERIEMRAFTVFLDEVRSRTQGPVAALNNLASTCKREDANFELSLIHWKQMQLSDMAKEFGSGVSDDPPEAKADT